MPAAPLPRAALPAMESEPVRVGRGSGLRDRIRGRRRPAAGIARVDQPGGQRRRRGGADPHPRLARRRSGVRFRAGAVGAARGAPGASRGGPCRRWWPRWRRWSAPPASPRWPRAAGGAARQDPGGGGHRAGPGTGHQHPHRSPGARRRRRPSSSRPRSLRPRLPPSFEERAPAPKKEDGPGFIRLSEGDFKLPSETCWSTCPRPRRRSTSRACTTWPPAWSRRCRTTA